MFIQWQPRHRNFLLTETSGRTGYITRQKLETALPECVSLVADAIHAPSLPFQIPNTVRRSHVGR